MVLAGFSNLILDFVGSSAYRSIFGGTELLYLLIPIYHVEVDFGEATVSGQDGEREQFVRE